MNVINPGHNQLKFGTSFSSTKQQPLHHKNPIKDTVSFKSDHHDKDKDKDKDHDKDHDHDDKSEGHVFLSGVAAGIVALSGIFMIINHWPIKIKK